MYSLECASFRFDCFFALLVFPGPTAAVSALFSNIAITSCISLISLFHPDQLPELMPIYSALRALSPDRSVTWKKDLTFADALAQQEQTSTEKAQMLQIKTVAVWVMTSFALFHPHVLVMFGLVPCDEAGSCEPCPYSSCLAS